MLYRITSQFLEYCRLADFSRRSIQVLAARADELSAYLESLKIRSVRKIDYSHLIDFVADYPASGLSDNSITS